MKRYSIVKRPLCLLLVLAMLLGVMPASVFADEAEIAEAVSEQMLSDPLMDTEDLSEILSETEKSEDAVDETIAEDAEIAESAEAEETAGPADIAEAVEAEESADTAEESADPAQESAEIAEDAAEEIAEAAEAAETAEETQESAEIADAAEAEESADTAEESAKPALESAEIAEGAADDAEAAETAEETQESAEIADAAEAEESAEELHKVKEVLYPEFSATIKKNGIEITVAAPDGVFPEDARLKVDAVYDFYEDAEAIGEAVQACRPEDRTVAQSYIFDIKVMDSTGRELQPNTVNGNVSVTFAVAQSENANLSTEVYHITDVDGNEMTAHPLEAEIEDGEVSVETDGFSYYVIELSYENITYRVTNYDELTMEAFLAAIGLTVGEDEEVLDITSSNEAVLFVTTNEDDEILLIPEGRGVSHVTITIGEDYDTAVEYKADFSIAAREDKIISGSEGPDDPQTGEEFLGKYTKEVDFTMAAEAPEMSDMKLAGDANYYEAMYMYYEILEESIYPLEFVYNGKTSWYTMMEESYSYDGYPVENLYPTGKSGLQLMPFAAIIGAEEDPEISVGFRNGKMLYAASNLAVKNQYYYAYSADYRSEYLAYGLREDHDLSLHTEVDLKLVCGYVICDQNGDYGYVVLDESNVFKFSATGLKITCDSSYVFGFLGTEADLTGDISVTGPNGPYTITVTNADEIDWNTGEGGEYYSSYGLSDAPCSCYYYELVYEIADNDGEVVLSTERYLCLIDQISANFITPGFSYYSSRGINEAYITTDADLAAAYNKTNAGTYANNSAPSYLFTESDNTAEELKSYIRCDMWGEYFVDVDPSWIELADDGGYESPWIWDPEEAEDMEDLFTREFDLVYEVGNPNSESKACEVSVHVVLLRPAESFGLSFELENGAADQQGEGRVFAADGEVLSAEEVKLPDTEVGDTSFWLCQFLDYIDGGFDYESYLDGESDFSIDISANYGNMLPGLEYSGGSRGCSFVREGYFNEDGSIVLEKSETSSGLGYKVSGNLDINRAGAYRIEISPIVDGTIKEELTLTFTGKVVPRRAASVTIANDKDLTIYKPFDGVYTADELTAKLLAVVTAKDEYGNDLDVEFVLRNGSGEEVSIADAAANMAEGDTYTIIYSATHRKDLTAFAQATHTVTVAVSDLQFTGIDGLTVATATITDFDHAMRGGVKALQENGQSVPFTYTTDYVKGAASGDYTITYSAVHPGTGKTYTAERALHVVGEDLGSSVLGLTLEDTSMTQHPGLPGQDPENFVLGEASQDAFTFTISYSRGSAETPSVEVYIPYGFELQGGSYATSGYTATLTGNYTSEGGSVLTLVPGLATTNIIDDITLIPHLEILYPALKNGYTDYVFSAQSFDNGVPCGVCTNAGYTFTAKDEICSDEELTMTAGTQEFTVNQLFSSHMFTSSYNGSAAYAVTVTKPAGKLPDPDWKLNFTLPTELGLNSTHPYYLVFVDEEGTAFASTANVTAVRNSDGSVTVPLYGDTRYAFTRIEGNMTYMDAVRQAAAVKLNIMFAAQGSYSGSANIKINLPESALPQGKGIANEGIMSGSEVDLFCGGDAAVLTADAIGVRLVNGTADLTPAADATTFHMASYVGAPSKDYISQELTEIATGGDGIHLSAPVLDNMATSGCAQDKWNMYKNLEVTIDYPYEYSPVAPYYYSNNSSYYDVYYTVSTPDADGNPVPVEGKENLKANLRVKYNYSTSQYTYEKFDADESKNEYVSSVTVKYKGYYKTILNNWESYERIKYTYVYDCLPCPIFQIRASYTKADGTAITEPYTVTISSSAEDDRYSTAVTTQDITVIPTNLEMKVFANNLSNCSHSDASLGGKYSSWKEDGIVIGFYTNTSTKKYTNAKLVITGEAVRLTDFSRYWFDDLSTSSAPKVIGYSTSSDASRGPWAEGEADLWIQGTEATKAASRDFRNIKDNTGKQIPITGVILDISGFTYSGSALSGGDNSYFHIGSYGLNSSTPFFDDLTKEDLDTNGYSVLDYSVFFHSDTGDANLTAADGKTAPISTGRLISSINQKSADYSLNPMAGDESRFDVSTMKLISISHGTTQRFNWEGYLGYHGKFTTVIESDGTPEGDALLSLTEGLYVSDYRTRITSVEYQTVSAEGKVRTKSTGFTNYEEWVSRENRYHKYYYDSDCGTSYVTYAPFNLETGEYVTRVTVNWANFSDNYTGYGDVPSVALLRASAVPEKTRTGYTLTEGQQLPCKVTSSYTTIDGISRNIVFSGISAKMCGIFTKALESYDVEEVLPVTTPKKGTTFAVQLNNFFAFEDSAVRLGDTRCFPWKVASYSSQYTGLVNANGDANYNKLRYTVYYRINKGFEYVAGSMSCSGGAAASFYPNTFADGSGLLKVIYSGYRLSGDGSATIKLRAGYDVEHANIAPILGAWLDASYDLKNSQTERNYTIIYGSSAVALDEAIISKLGLAAGSKALFCNLSDVVFPNRADADMFDYTITASASNGAFSKAEQGAALQATADSSFGIAGELVNTASDRSTDWNIYIPVPTKGKTVSVLESSGLTQSEASEFSLKLKEAVTAEDATVTYTTADDLSFNALTGANGGADGADYVSADEISDWSAVTAIHIYVPEVTKDDTKTFSVTFSDVEKTAVGQLKAYTTAYYNYRTIDGRMLFGKGGISSKYKYGTTTLSTFVLDDYYITGTVWNDLNKDGIMLGEPGAEGVTVKAVEANGDEIEALDSAEITATAVTDANGAYKLAVPNAGTYKLIVPRAGIYDITEQNADAAECVRSWAKDNGETELITLSCDLAIIGEDELVVNAGMLSDMNFGVICVDIEADDAFYGINQGPVTMDTLTTLFHASWKDRAGNPGAVTIDADCLARINEMISLGKTGAVAVTLRHTAADAAGMSVEKTVYLKLRDNSTQVPAAGEKKEYLAATGFQYPVSGELTASNARKMAFAEALDWEGNAYKTGKIAVDEAQLAVINAAIEDGSYDEEGYDLTFSTCGDEAENVAPVSLTVTVILEGSVTKKGKIGVTDYLTIENFSYNRSAGELTAEDVLRLSHVSGLDKRGSSIEEFSVDAESLAKINKAVANRKPGVYRIAVSSVGADAVTIKTAVTLTDSFVIAFSRNGGEGSMASVTVNYGQSLVLAANSFARAEYTYAGWSTSAAGEAAYEDGATLTASIINRLYALAADADEDGIYTATLYAAWNKIPGTAKINVSVSSGNLIGSRDVLFDLYQDGVSVCEAIGGTFTKTDAFTAAFDALDEGTYEVKMTCGQNIQTKTITLAKGGTADAAFIFKAETVYTVTYDAGEGTLPAGTGTMVRQISGYTYTMPECTPASANRVFVGWQTADGILYNKGEAVTGLYDGEESGVVIALTAVYRDRVYYISFVTGDGQIPASVQLPEAYSCGTAYAMPACESANGSIEFAGWKDAEGHLYTAGQEVTDVYSGDKDRVTVTLTAVWKYSVSFIMEDAQFEGGYTAPQYWTSDEKTTLPTCTCEDEELVFAGWRAEDGSLYKGGSNAINLYNTDEDGNGTTLTAVWKNKTYTVSFDAGEGSCLTASKSLANGQIFGKLPTPVLDGAEFDGWFTEKEGGVQISSDTIFDKTQTKLYAQWKKASYAVVINGTEEPQASFGEDYTFPVSEGYDIVITIGGNPYIPVNNEDGTYTIPGSDLKGAVTIQTIPGDAAYATVTYMFEDKAVAAEKVLRTGDYPDVSLPVLAGYDVTGWYDAALGGHKVSGAFAESGITVLYAHKAPHTFSISFDEEETSCEFGEEIVFEVPAPRSGYEFLGWQIEGGAFIPCNGGEFISFPMLSEDTVITSCWQQVGDLVVTVVDELEAPVSGAIVKVTQGNLILDGSGITDANGRAVFNNLPYGAYNIVVVSKISADTTVVTTSGKDITEETNTLSMTVPLFKLNTKVDSDDYNVTSEHLEDAISETIKAEIRNTAGAGKEVVLVLKATKLDDADPADAECKDAMDSFVEENTDVSAHRHLIEYVDLTVHQRITTTLTGMEDQVSETTVPETSEYQVISIEITPEMYAALAAINGTPENIVVYRSHEGVVSAMTKGENLSGECYWIKNVAGISYIVIKAKYFSVYAFGVQDEAVEYTTENPVVRRGIATNVPVEEVLTTGVEKWLIMNDHFAYISGYTDGTVRPDGDITRAETAMIFYKLLKDKNVEATASFSDVADDQWYTTAVRTLASLGIISGYTDGTFRPAEKITRAEFATIAMKFAEQNGRTVTFSDVASTHWAEQYISAAATYGWISGYTDGTFRPGEDITRAEAAVIINKMLCRTADEDYIQKNVASLRQFTDLQDSTKWYYKDMMEAANEHDFVAAAEGEIWY